MASFRPGLERMAIPYAGAIALRMHLPRFIGWTCFTAALLTFVSDRNRSILGRWSPPAAAAILCAGLVWCVAAWGLLGAKRYARADRHADLSPVLVDVAVLLWGVGYLWAALDAASNAGEAFDLNFFGSTTPAAIVLGWLALACLLGAGVSLMRRTTERWANVALSISTTAVLALLGEGAVRAKALVAPATEGFPTYAGALWTRRYVRLNRAGFRDTEHLRTRVRGTHRILLIGDSFAFGVGIPRTEDRLGERLALDLNRVTGSSWEVVNVSHPDRNTLDEITMLDSTVAYRPDVIILVYVFNDIDYLYPVTERTVLTEAPQTVWQRLHPVRVLFKNSFLFQEVYIRFWALRRSLHRPDPREDDPYQDPGLLRRHLADVARFVHKGRHAGAVVGIVPFDPKVAGDATARRRYETFVGVALTAGLPIWRADSAFDGLTIPQLTVNRLDGHPNEVANRLVATSLCPTVLAALAGELPR